MTATSAERIWSPSSHGETFKFPDFEPEVFPDDLTTHPEKSNSTVPISTISSPGTLPKQNGDLRSDMWQHKKDNHIAWGNGSAKGPLCGHGRQPSLSDAIRTIRTRKGSVSANAQEIAEALKAPVSVKLIVRSSAGTTRASSSPSLGTLHCVVHELSSDQYFYQIHIKRLSKTYHTYTHPIRFRFHMVLVLRIFGVPVSANQDSYTCP